MKIFISTLLFILFAINQLLSQDKGVQFQHRYQIRFSFLDFADTFAGGSLGGQISYSINDRFSINLDGIRNTNDMRDRFHWVRGYRVGFGGRYYLPNYSELRPNARMFISIDFQYKQQEYSLLAIVQNSVLNTTYFKDIEFYKQVFIMNLCIGESVQWNRRFGHEIGGGLSLRYRRMETYGLENEFDKVKTHSIGKSYSHWWADHDRNGLLPFVSAFVRINFSL